MMRISAMMVVALAYVLFGGDLWSAQASQGPGVAPGNASAMMQHVVAVLVYGAAGMLMVAGLIGTVRRRGAR